MDEAPSYSLVSSVYQQRHELSPSKPIDPAIPSHTSFRLTSSRININSFIKASYCSNANSLPPSSPPSSRVPPPPPPPPVATAAALTKALNLATSRLTAVCPVIVVSLNVNRSSKIDRLIIYIYLRFGGCCAVLVGR